MTIFVLFKVGQIHLIDGEFIDSRTICEIQSDANSLPEIKNEVRNLFDDRWLAVLSEIPSQFQDLKHIKI